MILNSKKDLPDIQMNGDSPKMTDSQFRALNIWREEQEEKALYEKRKVRINKRTY